VFENFKPFRSRAVANWEVVHLEVGDKFRGFVAGQVWGVPTHYFDGTTGCKKALTRGALPCACDTMKIETRWRGYVPLWDLNGVRWVVILGERYGQAAQTLKHMTQVEAARCDERGTPNRVVEKLWTINAPKLSQADALPQDIRRWMLRVWGDEALAQWFEENGLAAPPDAAPVTYTRVPTGEHDALVEKLRERILTPNQRDAKLKGTAAAQVNGIHKDTKRRG